MRTIRLMLLVVWVGLGTLSASWPALAQSPPREIRVMTWNVYSGATLGELLDADDPLDLLVAMDRLFTEARRTHFRARADAIADQIQATRPHIIGLQEVAVWRTQRPPDGAATPARNVAVNFQQLLLDALNERGLRYDVVSAFTGANIEAPTLSDEVFQDIRFTERNVILARRDSGLTFFNARRGRFDTLFTIDLPVIGEMSYRRGWASVDVRSGTRTFRFINTHLEAFSRSVRRQQVLELLRGPARTNRSVVLVGDFNAPAESRPLTIRRLESAGFRDVWDRVRQDAAGPTCCQDADLRNSDSELSSRVDLILVRGRISPRGAIRVGQVPEHQTSSGLWPSDHAGVVARLRLN